MLFRFSSVQQQRRQHQAELARQKNEETARRLASGGLGSGEGQGPNKSTGDIVAYRNVDDIPARELKIHVSGTRSDDSFFGLWIIGSS